MAYGDPGTDFAFALNDLISETSDWLIAEIETHPPNSVENFEVTFEGRLKLFLFATKVIGASEYALKGAQNYISVKSAYEAEGAYSGTRELLHQTVEFAVWLAFDIASTLAGRTIGLALGGPIGGIVGAVAGAASAGALYKETGLEAAVEKAVYKYFSTNMGPKLLKNGAFSDSEIHGTYLDERIVAGDGDNEIFGHGGADELHGGEGEDTINGGTGNDTLYGGKGADTFVFNAGFDHDIIKDDSDVYSLGDKVVFEGFSPALLGGAQELVDGSLKLNFNGSSIIIERFRLGDGSLRVEIQYADQWGLLGTKSVKSVQIETDETPTSTTFTSDAPVGEGALISIRAVIFDSQVIGGTGDDILIGGEGSDEIIGMQGDDWLSGGFGDDLLNGSTGSDFVDYSGRSESVIVDLDEDRDDGDNNYTGSASFGSGETDTLWSIEHVVGTSLADGIFGTNGSNFLIGNGGADAIFGRDGDDIIVVGDGAAYVDGGSGRDGLSFLDASGGVEVDLGVGQVIGGAAEGTEFVGFESFGGSMFDDTFWGTDVGDWLAGGEGDDSLRGYDGDDTLLGERGDDDLRGYGGDDDIDGGDGDDFIRPGEGNDSVDGGDGFDTLIITHENSSNILIDLEDGTMSGGGLGVKSLINIEAIVGGDYRDIVHGDDADNVLEGGDGDDDLRGRDGDDHLVGGQGDDDARGGDGQDTIEGGEGDDVLQGGAGVDFLFDGEGDDDIWGDEGDDFIELSQGEDKAKGGIGNDYFSIAYLGNDEVDEVFGGDGVDTVDLSKLSYAVTVHGDTIGGDGGGVDIEDQSIEIIVGTAFGDSFFLDLFQGAIGEVWSGDGADWVLSGGAGLTAYLGDGADEFDGGAGTDVVFGGAGSDDIDGGDGDDRIDGGLGWDTLRGGAGMDVFLGDLDGDTIQDFSIHDAIEGAWLQVVQFNYEVDTGQWVLSLDSDGDGQGDIDINLKGDFSSQGFLADFDEGKALVALEDFLPLLEEGKAVDTALVNGIVNQDYLTGDGKTTFDVKLQDLGFADYDNVVGVYEVQEDGTITDVRILFANANYDNDAEAHIDSVEEGNKLGFFIVQNSAAWAENLGAADQLEFLSPNGHPANAFHSGNISLAVNGEDTGLIAFHSFSQHLNHDGVQHALSGVGSSGNAIKVGFEDLTGGGDQDYEDVVFSVEANYDLWL